LGDEPDFSRHKRQRFQRAGVSLEKTNDFEKQFVRKRREKIHRTLVSVYDLDHPREVGLSEDGSYDTTKILDRIRVRLVVVSRVAVYIPCMEGWESVCGYIASRPQFERGRIRGDAIVSRNTEVSFT
jgi:hypothetical protein